MAYEVVERIGNGGFGVVDEVKDDEGEYWAKKTLDVALQPHIDPDELRARFEREVRYQSEVAHPNVVKIHDYDLDADPPWFIMELAENSLADELEDDHTLSGDPRQPLFDILAGLQALHERGFKHRDLTPANVLKFVEEDGGIRYAISDFGLIAPEAGQTTTLTGSNMGGGTPMYRAPECAINFKRATAQSDIYSVGAILHDIFGGKQTRIPHIELTVPGPLGEIVQHCTKTNPRRRYSNVGALRERLYEVLSVEEISFTSVEEEEIVTLLKGSDHLSDDEWDRVFNQIDENDAGNQSNHAIFRVLSITHIEQLADEAPELLASLGDDYAKYAQLSGFDFDYCDVIGTRARAIFERAELDLQARIAVSMFMLGTRHNRWFVERIFLRMAGKEISDTLAERIKIELEVQNINFSRGIEHLEWSISASREDLHSILQDFLNDAENGN
ncbi:serine/threonine-protein kinase [Thalassospiraceae bacterium LMO-JJ14]|nr:serine/threonine-protein kinase [Thalassospiraceae bacterium LMO-JJ14]